jgi:hypothetical protein
MWYLMAEGKRRAVMPHVVGDDPTLVDRALLAWLETHIFPSEPSAPARAVSAKRRRG